MYTFHLIDIHIFKEIEIAKKCNNTLISMNVSLVREIEDFAQQT